MTEKRPKKYLEEYFLQIVKVKHMGERASVEKTNIMKVSVIMPSLNVVGFIDDALESVMNQTLRDIEIICIDAGSTDGTYEKIEVAMKNDPRIMLLKSPLKSYGYQVNMGLDVSRGEYIAILETDDYVHSDMYEELYSVASTEKLDYVKCNYDTYSFDDKGEKTFSGRKISENTNLYEKVFVPSDYSETAFDDWYLWNGIYRSSFLKENNIRFSESRGAAFQDIGFLHKTTSRARASKYVNKSLYRYCVGRADASSKSDKTLRFIRSEYGSLLNDIGDFGSEKEWKLLYGRMAKSFARACMDCSDEMLHDAEMAMIIRWFQIRLLEAENKGFVSADVLPQGLRETYRHLINPAEGYLAFRKNRVYEISSFLGKDHPIIVFGCGTYGKEANNFLRNIGYKIRFFMDNSEKLWGTMIEGVSVASPQMIAKMTDDTRYIVANEKYSNEIKEQLKSHVDENRIMIF